MTDALRSELEAIAPAGERPELGDLWRSGRRRRRRARVVPMGAAAVAVLLLGTVLVALRAGNDGEAVTTAGPNRCTPAPVVGTPAPPRTVDQFVHGSGDGEVLRPTVVARVEVLRVWRVRVDQGQPLSPNLLEPTGGFPSKRHYERRADVRVIGPVVGARLGRRFVVADSATVRERETKRRLMRQIDDQQRRLDAVPTDVRAQATLEDLQQRLQIVLLSERVVDTPIQPTACHAFRKGDELIVAIRRSQRAGPIYELTNPSSFFLVDGDELSPELDAARRTVADWPDTPLARLARRSSPDELVVTLRAAR